MHFWLYEAVSLSPGVINCPRERVNDGKRRISKRVFFWTAHFFRFRFPWLKKRLYKKRTFYQKTVKPIYQSPRTNKLSSRTDKYGVNCNYVFYLPINYGACLKTNNVCIWNQQAIIWLSCWDHIPRLDVDSSDITLALSSTGPSNLAVVDCSCDSLLAVTI